MREYDGGRRHAEGTGHLGQTADIDVLHIDALGFLQGVFGHVLTVLDGVGTHGIVGVVILRHRTGEVETPVAVELVGQAELDAAVYLVDAGHHVVDEGDAVVVETVALDEVVEVGLEHADTTLEAVEGEDIVEVGREDARTLEVVGRFVADAGRDVGVVGQGGHGAIDDVGREELAAAELVRQSALEHHVGETVVASGAVGVVGVVAVAHGAAAEEVGVCQLEAVVGVPVAYAVVVDEPALEGVDIDLEVVAEDAALIDLAVGPSAF